MTSRERILCVLAGDIPDRVPVSPFVQEEYLSWYFGKKDTDRLFDAVTLAQALNFDLITRQYLTSAPYFLLDSAPNWSVTAETRVEGGNYYRTYTVTTPKGVLKQVEAAPYDENILSGIHFSTVEYLIKDSDDFEIFRAYLPSMSSERRAFFLEKGRIARETIGQQGITCPWSVGGVYNMAATFINVQDMMMDSLSDEAYYQEYMDFFTGIVMESHTLLAESAFDAIGIQGNIANGAMLGEQLFNDHVLPYEKKALDILHQAGKSTIYHNCGAAKPLYPCYKALGITVWETVSPPPQGDNSLAKAKAYFGKSLVLSGNFDQVRFLKTGTPQAIEEAAQAQMEIGKPGGHYIFAASDYLEQGTALENVQAMLRGAKAAAAY